MSKMFRSAPMGFNKKDVVDYIEKLASEKNQMAEEKDARIKELEKEVSDLVQYRDQSIALMDRTEELHGENERLLADKEELENAIKIVEEQRLELADRISRLEAELAASVKSEKQLHQRLAEGEEELRSLKKHNLRLLAHNEELSRSAAYKTTDDEVRRAKEKAREFVGDVRQSAKSAQELFGTFKGRVVDISRELSALAQAILDADKRENPDDVCEDMADFHEDTPIDPAERYLNDEITNDLHDDEDDIGTEIVMEDYPTASTREEIYKRNISVREILDRIKSIGDKLL